MFIQSRLTKLIAGLALMACCTAAQAAKYNGTFGFSGPLVAWDGSDYPVTFSTSFSGTFIVDFDVAVGSSHNDRIPEALDVTIEGISYNESNVALDIERFAADRYGFTIGFTQSWSSDENQWVYTNANDWAFVVFYDTTTEKLTDWIVYVARQPTLPGYGFATKGLPATSGNDVTFHLSPISVPEPAAWMMIVTGIGMVGATLRHTQRWKLRTA